MVFRSQSHPRQASSPHMPSHPRAPMFADKMLRSLKLHVVSLILGVFTSHKVWKIQIPGRPSQVCQKPGLGPQTLIRHIVAVTGPICAPLPLLLQRQHKFGWRPPFQRAKAQLYPISPTRKILFQIEIEIETVYNVYRMRRFTTITECAGCCLWTLPTMPYMKLTSQG
jgi:hypothetical protein